jgi:hypothetical protein
MKRKFFVLLIVGGLFISLSCSNSRKENNIGSQVSIDKILQGQDGTISLAVDRAVTYSDMSNPSDNTAEWNVLVSKKSRYNVWLSSYTRDTTSLNYQDSVRVSVEDNKILKALPTVDRIMENRTDGSMPYRADSFIGSLVIPDTGLVSIQVISEKILPRKETLGKEDSKLVSVILTPEKRMSD